MLEACRGRGYKPEKLGWILTVARTKVCHRVLMSSQAIVISGSVLQVRSVPAGCRDGPSYGALYAALRGVPAVHHRWVLHWR